ncbi:hypothetical protein [Porphyromonas gingivalis]|uniref:hypothetical protein n=2 Tax=Porphyromonas gingivalis TaxID=837 RepID=UPI003BAB1D2E
MKALEESVGSTLYLKGTHNMILDWWLGRWNVEGGCSVGILPRWGFFTTFAGERGAPFFSEFVSGSAFPFYGMTL